MFFTNLTDLSDISILFLISPKDGGLLEVKILGIRYFK